MANEKEIKKAYRQLAKQYHPDRNAGDAAAEAKFKEVSEAYEVLSDSEKRDMYDRFGSQWKDYQRASAGMGGMGGSQGFAQQIRPEDLERIFGKGFGGFGGATGGGGSGFSDFFETLFGGGMSGRGGAGFGGQGFGGASGRSAPQSRIEQEVEVSLEEAFAGTTRLMTRQDGSSFQAKIPAGVKSGSKIKLRGAANGQDVYLVISVQSHQRYERDGNDLRVSIPVDVYTAVLGGQAAVPTIDKTVNLNIPAGTNGGRTIRLRGLGMPILGNKEGERGDLYATIELQIPTDLSDEERDLFEQLRALRETES